ncbi:hypothetical protein [Nostoc sp. 106C]|uniref:hypothetical protein n=1 Tax=Nostoc sp. 106C TaxID=1932667 RepID=UPI000A3C2C78|nr:hypothetical protein BV375_16130 [Nostoc sp. 106C]
MSVQIPVVIALASLWGEKINVGWGATHVGGFPDLSEVAFERSETQLDQGLRMLGFVPQPNLRLNL